MTPRRPGPLARLVARRPALVLGLALAATGLAFVPASRLTIRTDLEALLPLGAPASDAYRAFLDGFGGIEKVFVTLRLPDGVPADPETLADAAESFAAALLRSPEVRRVRYGWDEGDEAFLVEHVAPRLPLLLDDAGLAGLPARLTPSGLAERAAAIKDAAAGPGGFFLSRIVAADPLGLLEERLRALTAESRLPIDPMTGALISRDRRAVLLVVTPTRGEADAAGGRALARALDAAYAASRGSWDADLTMSALGGPLYAARDEQALRRDLIRILTAASVLIVGMIALAFDGISIPAISIAAVAVGQIWCAGLVGAWLGAVTVIGVGFAAILLGLGDDFTIHLGARFRELWREGSTTGDALERAVAESGPGIVAAALTTAAAFACLAFASFRPFRELGIVVAVGVVLLLVATFAAAAPALALASRRWRRDRTRRPWRGFSRVVEVCVGAGRSRPRLTLALVAAVTLIGAVLATRLRIDTNLARLRPSDPATTRAERALIDQFGVGLDTTSVIVPGRTRDDALDRAAAVAALLRSSLPEGAGVESPSDWIVGGRRMATRLGELAPLRLDEAASRLTAALDREGLDPAAFSRVLDGLRSLAAGREPGPIPEDAWPDWIAEETRTTSAGVAVAVRARTPAGVWPHGPPEEALAAIARIAPGAQVANAPRIGAEVKALALSDLARLGGLATAVVLAIVLLSYRGDLVATGLTFLPVVIGTVCTAGLWGALGRRLDLFSLAVVPVLVGIGVDDGLHVLHLARQRGADLQRAAQEAGRGVVLTNATTCAGFASLAVSQVPGLRNGGLLICAGNLLCLAATLLVLPAIDGLRRRRD